MRPTDLSTLLTIAQELPFYKLHSQIESQFQGFGTDTRQALDAQVFIALKGESFDAHDYLKKAVEQKAAALVVHRISPEQLLEFQNQLTILEVSDTLLFLQKIAHYYRKKSKALVIGITGSNGKTTSKEFSAQLCASALGNKVHYNKGSFNNHWGVPFTLLQCPSEAEVCIVEMGMNHPGELTELVKIAEPQIVVCTTVGKAHIEFFGSIEKIAEAKGEIYEASPARSTRIYNLDNASTFQLYLQEKKRSGEKMENKRGPLLCFSSQKNHAEKVHVLLNIVEISMKFMRIEGQIGGLSGSCQVAIFGSQNLTNLMVAASVGLAIGLKPEQIWEGLSRCKTNWGRNQLVETESGAQLLFDAYNANPDSMKALLDNLPLLKNEGRKIGVFAEMRELGPSSSALHEQFGKEVGESQLDEVWFYGSQFKNFEKGLLSVSSNKKYFVSENFDKSHAIDMAKSLKKGDIVLIKGSRSMKLEQFVELCQPLNFGSLQK